MCARVREKRGGGRERSQSQRATQKKTHKLHEHKYIHDTTTIVKIHGADDQSICIRHFNITVIRTLCRAVIVVRCIERKYGAIRHLLLIKILSLNWKIKNA